MKVQVLGTGCARCDNLLANAKEAVSRIPEIEETVNVEKIVDPEVFFRLKVFVTPALVIDENVISSGKVLSVDEIQSELLKHLHGENT
jgi:small redox-active disulfide protein 2